MLGNPIRCITQLDDQFPVHDRKKLAPVVNIKNSLNKILKKVLVVKKIMDMWTRYMFIYKIIFLN